MESEENFDIAIQAGLANDKEKLIKEIKADKSLDPDTQLNAIKATELFSVNYDDAIKIAEMVNLLWEGQRRFEEDEDGIGFYRTRPQEEVFREKIFPIAKTYKDVRSINEIPEDVIIDIKDFKENYSDYYLMNEFNENEESREIFDNISEKIKKMEGKIEFQNDSEWSDILNKLDQVNFNILDKKEKKFIEVSITKALLDYNEKQKNIVEREENEFGVRGFEKCDEFSGEEIKKFLNNNFNRELLAKSLIAEIIYSSKFKITGDYKSYDEDEYLKLAKEKPDIKEKVFRGAGAKLYNCASIIDIYNHKHGDIPKYNYLDNYTENDKIKAYLLGTIIHETAGHHFYDRILKLSERKEYENVCQDEESEKSVTYYVKKHKNGLFMGNIYAEDFSDSMRRFMTDYEDFKEEFPKRVEFIERKFPEIVKDGIHKFLEENSKDSIEK